MTRAAVTCRDSPGLYAKAPALASEAGEWTVVGKLASELEARRMAHGAGNVVPLDRGRRRGG